MSEHTQEDNGSAIRLNNVLVPITNSKAAYALVAARGLSCRCLSSDVFGAVLAVVGARPDDQPAIISQRGRALLTALLGQAEEERAEHRLDENYVERLMRLLESGDPTVSRLAAEELEIQTARWSPEDSGGLITDLLDIVEKDTGGLTFSLIRAVQNILNNADEASRNTVREKTLNAMERQLASPDARVRHLALRITLSLQEGDTYEYLLDKYIQALREGSDLLTDIRGALLSSHRERIPELRVTLLEIYKSSDESLRERIGAELTQTRQ